MKRYRFLTSSLLALVLMLATLLAVAMVSAQQQGSVSGRVYCDANRNYNYDAGEEVAGVTVTLYDDATCDYIPDTPALATQPSAADGTYSFTGLDVGVDWASRECYFVGADETAPELGNCTYLEWNPQYFYLYGNIVDWTNLDFRFQEIWDKTVDGQPWVPDLTVTAETSDTIEVIDTIYLPRGDRDLNEPAQQESSYILIESWNPAELDLVDVEWDAFTTVIEASGRLTWTVPMYQTPVPTATITKTFHVETCTWNSTTLQEDLYEFVEGTELIDQRPVVINKTQPDLWIDSTYDSEVSPGELANFTLTYGNNGGFEDVTWIRNVFPPEAPFDSSSPAADWQAADGSWAEWDLGSLANGDTGSIDVTVAIQAGLTPSTTMVITDYLYNHAEQVADQTVITFHIEQPPLSLGDYVWYDTNQDGIQGAGEPGVPDILVTLYPRVCDGQAIGTDTTDANGNYLFENLSPGIYCLQFSNIPAGWFITAQNQGADDTVDSDADTATAQITDINLQTDDLDEDMGLYAEGSIGDTVFCDANENGVYDTGEGVAGVTVSLSDDPGCDGLPINPLTSQDTTGDGQYLFTDLAVGPPGGALCYYVEVDVADMGACDTPITPIGYAVPLNADAPNDLDNDFGFQQRLASIGDWVWDDVDQDGIQDETEQGIADVTVMLYYCEEKIQADTTTTDANGFYSFDGVEPGSYYLAFLPPLSYEFTLQNQGSDPTLDSDPNPTTGETVCFYFEALEDDLTRDAGLFQPPPPPTPTPTPEPPIVPEPSTLLLLGGAVSGLAGYIGLQLRARRRR